MPIIYLNHVGGQDELVFDGASLMVDAQGHCTSQLASFEEHLAVIAVDLDTSQYLGPNAPTLSHTAAMYQALVIGTRDYLHKNSFQGALLGLSGGIDSALTLSIAVDALGPEHVTAVMMPSRYTSDTSIADAKSLANALNVTYLEYDIEASFQALLQTLNFDADPASLSVQNLQARCRGMLLMALSNKEGRLVLGTSNKSELAVGYSTLYGDMVGAFNVLKDVYKTEVYELAAFCNRFQTVIPARILERAPTAELAPNQCDQDTLPDYEILDAILYNYIEQHASRETLIAKGLSATHVDDTLRRLHQNEYKRQQAPPGPKITTRSFGRDWRWPLTSGFIF